jgi:hypothetical protein
MARGITIELEGFQQVINNLKKEAGKIADDVDEVIEGEGVLMAKAAQRLAPTDVGFLKNSISFSRVEKLVFEFVAQKEYAAFVEFGTKKKVNKNLTPEERAVAAQFQGKKGGSISQMEKNILAWVRRKQITGTYSVRTRRRTGNRTNNAKQDERFAKFIMWKILTEGIKPQPYFFPAYFAYKKEIVRKVTQILKKR